jgi:short-subunit dehydrogenase
MTSETQSTLNGAHVVLVGGSSGIGLAAAAAVKARGAEITLIGRTRTIAFLLGNGYANAEVLHIDGAGRFA